VLLGLLVVAAVWWRVQSTHRMMGGANAKGRSAGPVARGAGAQARGGGRSDGSGRGDKGGRDSSRGGDSDGSELWSYDRAGQAADV